MGRGYRPAALGVDAAVPELPRELGVADVLADVLERVQGAQAAVTGSSGCDVRSAVPMRSGSNGASVSKALDVRRPPRRTGPRRPRIVHHGPELRLSVPAREAPTPWPRSAT